jgi:hypothetical protein
MQGCPGTRVPAATILPSPVHGFATHTFELGRGRVNLESGEENRIYYPERNVVDAMRLRSQVGTDLAQEPPQLPGRPWDCAQRPAVSCWAAQDRRPMADALKVLTG